MSENFARFVKELAESPEKVRKLQEDPEGVMNSYHLTKSEKAICRIKDRAKKETRVKEALGSELQASNILILIDDGGG